MRGFVHHGASSLLPPGVFYGTVKFCRSRRPPTDESSTTKAAGLVGVPKHNTYSLEKWNIVPQPQYSSGKLCKSHFTVPEKFLKVEWPEEHIPQFTCFPELPRELQMKIWKCAHPESGIIDLRIEHREGPGYLFYVATTDKHTIATRQTHVAVCHLSRKVFLEHYHPIQLKQPPKFVSNYTAYNQLRPPLIYINENYDTVILNADTLHQFNDTGGRLEIPKIQHLAFSYYTIIPSRRDQFPIFKYLETNFPSLKTITIIVNNAESEPVKTLRSYGFRGQMSKNPKYEFQFVPAGELGSRDVFWDNPASTFQSEFSGSSKRVLPNPWNQASIAKRRIKIELGREIRDDPTISAEKWNSMDFKYCLLAKQDDLEWWTSEILYLVPREKENDKFAYYTIRPIAPYPKHRARLLVEEERNIRLPDSPGPQYTTMIGKQYLSFFLNPKRETLDELYDGISRLFGEEIWEGSPETQEELVYSAKCNWDEYEQLVYSAKCNWDEYEQLVYIPQVQQERNMEARSSPIYCKKYGSQSLELREWKSINGDRDDCTWFSL